MFLAGVFIGWTVAVFAFAYYAGRILTYSF